MRLQGRNLNLALEASDVVVMVGNASCMITHLDAHSLHCQPPAEEPSTSHASEENVHEDDKDGIYKRGKHYHYINRGGEREEVEKKGVDKTDITEQDKGVGVENNRLLLRENFDQGAHKKFEKAGRKNIKNRMNKRLNNFKNNDKKNKLDIPPSIVVINL